MFESFAFVVFVAFGIGFFAGFALRHSAIEDKDGSFDKP
jgi:hypothetical protein